MMDDDMHCFCIVYIYIYILIYIRICKNTSAVVVVPALSFPRPALERDSLQRLGEWEGTAHSCGISRPSPGPTWRKTGWGKAQKHMKKP